MTPLASRSPAIPPTHAPRWQGSTYKVVAALSCSDQSWNILQKNITNSVDRYLVVGAPGAVGTGPQTGAAVLYRRSHPSYTRRGADAGRWVHQCTFRPSDWTGGVDRRNARFGASVSIRDDGNGAALVAVGMPGVSRVALFSVEISGACQPKGIARPVVNFQMGSNVAAGSKIGFVNDELYFSDPISNNGWYGSRGRLFYHKFCLKALCLPPTAPSIAIRRQSPRAGAPLTPTALAP